MSQALKTDLYQLTMMQVYFEKGHNPRAVFDYFVRRIPFGSYLVVAGTAFVLEYLRRLRFTKPDIAYLRTTGLFTKEFLFYLETFRFTGDVYGMHEGEIAFPHEPILRVEAPLMEAQLIETFLLNKMNFSTLIATKASRVVYAARGRPVMEFGFRRAQGDAAIEASRACFIGGCSSTSNVEAGAKFGIPVAGTMAHSFVMSFDSEQEAFEAYSEAYPDSTTLLIDTYDTLRGVRKAIEVANKLEQRGKRLRAVRLDSGDFASLSQKVRLLLDGAGLSYVNIVASSDLNEWKIEEMFKAVEAAGGESLPIDVFGVGTEMVTARPDPALGGVYKLAEVDGSPRMKLSEEPGKTTLPGRKTVWRIYDHLGSMRGDEITLVGEHPSMMAIEMLVPLMRGGKIVPWQYGLGLLGEARQRIAMLPDRFRALSDACPYSVEVSVSIKKLQDELGASFR